jgi:hypothetical protein
MDRLEVRVSITKLLLALIIIIVPLSVVGLILTQQGDKSLANSVGNDFKTIAQLMSNEISQLMKNRIADVNTLAKDPTIIAAAAASQPKTGKAPDKAMLGSPASQMLRERKALYPQILSIVVTNQNGDVVAASQQPVKLSYAQDGAWQSVYNNGQGSAKVSDIVDDEFTKSDYVNIGVPINDATSGSTVGVISAAVNVSDLLTRFRDAQVGNGARAELVNDDGTIVSAPDSDVFAHAKSQQFAALRDSIGGLQGSESGWLMANLQRGPYIVAYAATGLKQHFPNLGWAVLVSQEEHQAAAPIRGLEHFALAMVILATFMLTLLCVYYFIHRSEDFEEIERGIHAEQPRAAATSV